MMSFIDGIVIESTDLNTVTVRIRPAYYVFGNVTLADLSESGGLLSRIFFDGYGRRVGKRL